MKSCNRCLVERPLSDFNAKCDTHDGRTSRCKTCLTEVRRLDYARRKDDILRANRERYAANSAAILGRRKELYNSERAKQTCREYRRKNPEKVRAINEAWAAANRDKLRGYWRNYSSRNREMRNAASIHRRFAKRNATPNWDAELTDFVTKEAVRLARLRSRMFGFEWHVDHAIPLLNKQVCGLHVWSNLQVIPGSVNQSKSNKFEVSA